MSTQTVIIPTFDDGPIAVRWRAPGHCPSSQDEMLADLQQILVVLAERGIRAVFYVLYVSHNTAYADESPLGAPDRIKEVFNNGVRAICDAGHIVALHAFEHSLYRQFLLPKDMALADVQRLMSALDEAPVDYAKTWRPPYGGSGTIFLDESDVAKDLGLKLQTWRIDSEDWVHHHDSTSVKKPFCDDNEGAWLANVTNSLTWNVWSNGGRGANWADILFHVNRRTADNLSGILDAVENSYRRVYGLNSWGPTAEFDWLKSNKSPAILDYLGE